MSNQVCDSFLSEAATLGVPLILEVCTVFLLGSLAIPLLRAKKTGRLEWRIGKRSKTDGSEPSMGGVVAALAFSVWFFPLAVISDLNGSYNKQDSREGLIFAGIYVIIIVCAGAAEDRLKKFLGRPAGLPPVIKQLYIYSASLLLLLAVSLFGREYTEVLLPFNMGFIEFGVLYYPLVALFMTVCINIFRLHFCLGSDDRDSVGGLSEVSGALSLVTVGLCCEECYSYAGSLLANVAAAACVGMLIWTLSPSKLITGESGAMFAGAAFSAAVVLSKLELLFLLAALPQTGDAIVAAVNHLRFRRHKSRGDNTLPPKLPAHLMLRERGHSDHLIIILFSVLSLIGGAASLLFAVYAGGYLFMYL